MKSTRNILLALLFSLIGWCAWGQDQNTEDYHIYPTDSVVVHLPIYNNTIFIKKNPSHGDLRINSDNSEFRVVYDPDNSFLGLDTFQIIYFVPGDNNGLTKKSLRAIIQVSKFMLHDDEMAVFTDDTLLLDVLGNDVINDSSARINYLPIASRSGLLISSDSLALLFSGGPGPMVEHLSYRVCDGGGYCETAKLKLIVKAHQADADQTIVKFMRKNETLEFEYPYDSMQVATDAGHGDLSVAGNQLIYKVDSAFTGIDTFAIGFGNSSALHTFIIHVLDVAQPNVLAFDDYFYTLTNQTVKVDLLKNDFIRDLEVTLIDNPEHGSVVRLSNGIYNYTPNTDFNGIDAFVYKACETNSDVCEYGAVYVTTAMFAPDYTSRLATAKNTDINISYPFPASGYRVSTEVWPLHGSIIPNRNKVDFKYDPADDYVGQDSFKVKYYLMSDPSVYYIVRVVMDIFDVQTNCNDHCLWPGDHNNDGRVDMRDLTFMAPFIGYSGPARDTDLNNIWIGQSSNDWQVSSGDVNIKYSDSDGNGIITDGDTTMLAANYKKTHGIRYNRDNNSSQLPIKLKSDKEYYYPGDSIIIDVKIGDDSWPIQNLTGFTATFNFSDAFNDQSLTGNIGDNSWLSESASLIHMIKKPLPRSLDFGAARIGGSGVPGHGKIGVIKGIIDESIEGFRLLDGVYYAPIDINEATITTEDGMEFRYTPQTVYIPIIVNQKPIASNNKKLIAYPNPVNDQLTIETTDTDNEIISVDIYSINGQHISRIDNINKNKFQLNFGNYSPGLYLAKSFTNSGVEVIKVEKF